MTTPQSVLPTRPRAMTIAISSIMICGPLMSACGDAEPIATCTPDDTLPVETDDVVELGVQHYGLTTEIVIDAPAEHVWSVLTDWEQMPTWSSTFQGISGDIRDGGQVVARYLNQGQILEIPHTLIFEEGVKFGWSDPTGPSEEEPFGGFVDHHIFEVEAISACQSRFIQSDNFEGEGNATFDAEGIAHFLVPVYQVFNAELKAQAEL